CRVYIRPLHCFACMDDNLCRQEPHDCKIGFSSSGRDKLSSSNHLVSSGSRIVVLRLSAIQAVNQIFCLVSRELVIVVLEVGKSRRQGENMNYSRHVPVDQAYKLVVADTRECNRVGLPDHFDAAIYTRSALKGRRILCGTSSSALSSTRAPGSS